MCWQLLPLGYWYMFPMCRMCWQLLLLRFLVYDSGGRVRGAYRLTDH